MSYLDMANLTRSESFRSRLSAALVEQAKVYFNPDEWTIDSQLAIAVLRSPETWTANWAPSVATEPGFADAYAQHGADGITDAMLLSAVQTMWTRMARLWEPTFVGQTTAGRA